MSATWYAVGCWAPLIIWALLERKHRKEAQGYADFWQKASERSDTWRHEKVAEFLALRRKYDALAADQNHTKRRAIKAELRAEP